MPTPLRFLLACFCLPAIAVAQDHPWQNLLDPTAAQVAVQFATPPVDYGLTMTWGWQGNMDLSVITRDLDSIQARGVHAVTIEGGNHLKDPYGTPGYFDTMRLGIEEAKKRGMRVWIIDEGKYPSGFAGGKFSSDRPDLRMQALAVDSVPAPAGQLFSQAVAPEIIAAVAVNEADQSTQLLDMVNGTVSWTPPAGDWHVALVRHEFRTSPTRGSNNPSIGAKDTSESLMDYLNPAATAQFLAWTHEEYYKRFGPEFGHTLLGIRSDEPEFEYRPWTQPWSPAILDEFQKRKGYDVRPYLPLLAAANPQLDEIGHRVTADYWDVWSSLYGQNFFAQEAAWCAAHGIDYQVHIDHEEVLPSLARADGDFFKCMAGVPIPGIDTISQGSPQIWMDRPDNFPKLASSVAHLFGRPRSWCEAFAGYSANATQAEWVVNHLLVNGINCFEFMFYSATSAGGGRGNAAGNSTARPAAPALAAAASNPAAAANITASSAAHPNRSAGAGTRYYNDPAFPQLVAYVNRLAYVLSQGCPAAQIGLYVPSSSFWLGDTATNHVINLDFLEIARQLLDGQRDCDYVDEQALSSVLQLHGATLVNRSGQALRAIIVPPVGAISQAALANLQAFAAAGGKVVFIGQAPSRVVGKNFLTASGPPDISWAVFEPTVAVTPAVLAALPPPDFSLSPSVSGVRYNHRRLQNADVYFVFNETSQPVSGTAVLAATGDIAQIQSWDARSGQIQPLPAATSAGGHATVPLALDAGATQLIVLTTGNAAPAVASASR